ncbi:hypothetical protein JKP88DRAFT_293153, partial [Tribonema minus]
EAVSAVALLEGHSTLYPHRKAVAQDVAQEYLKFMALKAHEMDVTGVNAVNARLMPSPLVDEMWRCHIVDTVAYQKFCEAILGPGGFVHHSPVSVPDVRPESAAGVARTRAVYVHSFQQTPPTHVWGSSEAATSAAPGEAAAADGATKDAAMALARYTGQQTGIGACRCSSCSSSNNYRSANTAISGAAAPAFGGSRLGISNGAASGAAIGANSQNFLFSGLPAVASNTLCIKDMTFGHGDQFFALRHFTSLTELYDAYGGRVALNPLYLKFNVHGRDVRPGDTAQTLGLRDGDVLYCVYEAPRHFSAAKCAATTLTPHRRLSLPNAAAWTNHE